MPVASETLEVLFHCVLLGPSPLDLHTVVVGLMNMVARKTRSLLDAASANIIDQTNIADSPSQDTVSNGVKLGAITERDALHMSSSDLDIPPHSFSSGDGPDDSPFSSSAKKYFENDFEVDLQSSSEFPRDTALYSKGKPNNKKSFEVHSINKGVVKARASRFESPPISSSRHHSNLNHLHILHDLNKMLRDDDEDLSELPNYCTSFSQSRQRNGNRLTSDGENVNTGLNEVIPDPHHIPVIQRCCYLACGFISLHVTQYSNASVSSQQNAKGLGFSLNTTQQDALLHILLRGGRRIEAVEALAMWGRSVSLFALCVRVAASSNVISNL